MYVMIDNFDSFVYNLEAYFHELGREIVVRRCDEITLDEIEAMQPEGIILSPGPKRPWDATLCVDAVRRFAGKIPILGVCLGHQVLGHVSGARVQKGKRPMHGRVTTIRNNGNWAVCRTSGKLCCDPVSLAGRDKRHSSRRISDRCSGRGWCGDGSVVSPAGTVWSTVPSGSRPDRIRA